MGENSQAGIFDKDQETIKNLSAELKKPKLCEPSQAELLHLLVQYEAELQALEICIATLKAEKAKQFLYQAKYGRLGLNDPLAALQRDSEACGSNDDFDEASVGLMYDSQLVQLEKLIASQRAAHQRMKQMLTAAEKRHIRVVREFDEERRKHAQDTAHGDDVFMMLEKERERLKQQIEFEQAQQLKLEKDAKRLEQSLADERERHKEIVLYLMNERRQLATRFSEERQRSLSLAETLRHVTGANAAEGVRTLQDLRREADRVSVEQARMAQELAAEREENVRLRALILAQDDISSMSREGHVMTAAGYSQSEMIMAVGAGTKRVAGGNTIEVSFTAKPKSSVASSSVRKDDLAQRTEETLKKRTDKLTKSTSLSGYPSSDHHGGAASSSASSWSNNTITPFSQNSAPFSEPSNHIVPLEHNVNNSLPTNQIQTSQVQPSFSGTAQTRPIDIPSASSTVGAAAAVVTNRGALPQTRLVSSSQPNNHPSPPFSPTIRPYNSRKPGHVPLANPTSDPLLQHQMPVVLGVNNSSGSGVMGSPAPIRILTNPNYQFSSKPNAGVAIGATNNPPENAARVIAGSKVTPTIDKAQTPVSSSVKAAAAQTRDNRVKPWLDGVSSTTEDNSKLDKLVKLELTTGTRVSTVSLLPSRKTTSQTGVTSQAANVEDPNWELEFDDLNSGQTSFSSLAESIEPEIAQLEAVISSLAASDLSPEEIRDALSCYDATSGLRNAILPLSSQHSSGSPKHKTHESLLHLSSSASNSAVLSSNSSHKPVEHVSQQHVVEHEQVDKTGKTAGSDHTSIAHLVPAFASPISVTDPNATPSPGVPMEPPTSTPALLGGKTQKKDLVTRSAGSTVLLRLKRSKTPDPSAMTSTTIPVPVTVVKPGSVSGSLNSAGNLNAVEVAKSDADSAKSSAVRRVANFITKRRSVSNTRPMSSVTSLIAPPPPQTTGATTTPTSKQPPGSTTPAPPTTTSSAIGGSRTSSRKRSQIKVISNVASYPVAVAESVGSITTPGIRTPEPRPVGTSGGSVGAPADLLQQQSLAMKNVANSNSEANHVTENSVQSTTRIKSHVSRSTFV